MGSMGVLLMRDGEQGKGVYRSVGTANTWMGLSKIKSNMSTAGDRFYYADFAPQIYEGYDGAGQYTVGIM
jgi:hypothetical protein